MLDTQTDFDNVLGRTAITTALGLVFALQRATVTVRRIGMGDPLSHLSLPLSLSPLRTQRREGVIVRV